MKKIDGIVSLIIGFFIGLFFFIIVKSIGFDFPYLWILIIVFPPLSLLGMLTVSFLGKKFLVILQAGKFALVGALNTFIDLGILNLLMWISGIALGPWYAVFKGTSFLIATTNSYFWNKHWTFVKEDTQGKKDLFASEEFSKFLAMTGIGLILNVGIASLVVNLIGPQFGISNEIWATIGALTATLFAWVWNFLSSKFFVFKR
jgi:putative flippase GtrA